jgi:hypothetical protein
MHRSRRRAPSQRCNTLPPAPAPDPATVEPAMGYTGVRAGRQREEGTAARSSVRSKERATASGPVPGARAHLGRLGGTADSGPLGGRFWTGRVWSRQRGPRSVHSRLNTRASPLPAPWKSPAWERPCAKSAGSASSPRCAMLAPGRGEQGRAGSAWTGQFSSPTSTPSLARGVAPEPVRRLGRSAR